MAKVSPLPSGKDILDRMTDRSQDQVVPYGNRCRVEWDANRQAMFLRNTNGRWLAVYRDGRPLDVNLSTLDPLVLPYVHMFGAHEGLELRRIASGRKGAGSYFRVGAANGSTGRVPVAAAISGASSSVIEDDEVETPLTQPEAEKHAATITVTSETTPQESPLRDVPGIIFPSGKAKVKGAGTGWVEVGGVLLPKDDLQTLDDAWTLSNQGESGGVLITGPAGTAKTHLVRAWADARGIAYLKVDGGSIRTVDDWSGGIRQDLATGHLAHKWAPFAQALRAGVPLCINVDELTRTESTAALNALLGLMDDSGTLSVPEANAVLTRPKGVLIVATANIGPEFSGTLPLDGAVRQRFALSGGIRMDYPTPAIEAGLLVSRYGVTRDVADTLVRFAAVQRKDRGDFNMYPSRAVVSTRLLLSMARNIGLLGRPVRDSVIRVCKTQFNEADDKALTVAIDAHFPVVTKTAPPSSAPATIAVGKHYFTGGVPTTPFCQYTPVGSAAPCGMVKTNPIHLD
jgi:MoxR-like ATPase